MTDGDTPSAAGGTEKHPSHFIDICRPRSTRSDALLLPAASLQGLPTKAQQCGAAHPASLLASFPIIARLGY